MSWESGESRPSARWFCVWESLTVEELWLEKEQRALEKKNHFPLEYVPCTPRRDERSQKRFFTLVRRENCSKVTESRERTCSTIAYLFQSFCSSEQSLLFIENCSLVIELVQTVRWEKERVQCSKEFMHEWPGSSFFSRLQHFEPCRRDLVIITCHVWLHTLLVSWRWLLIHACPVCPFWNYP